ncbi:MAG: YfiR family protein [Armatimonadetes bacterium]|nr:YfiR family protein [Armatimonadota bacterium]
MLINYGIALQAIPYQDLLMTYKTHLIVLLISFLCMISLSSQVNASPTGTDAEVKAAFVCQFPNFIDWPDSAFTDANSPFVIGVLGDDPFGSTLDNMVKGKTINGRKMIVKRSNSVNNLQSCQIVFISSSEKYRLSRIIDSFKGSNALLVSDINDFAKKGGIIGFIYKDNKIAIQINQEAAKRSKLKISSKLLRLADIVGN